jgi:hypothetical protein
MDFRPYFIFASPFDMADCPLSIAIDVKGIDAGRE